MNKNIAYCGHIGIIGKTNVGKSSILNRLIGKKISIISNKSGTTKKNITGIKNLKKYQFIYIDTPGIEIYKNNIKNNILNIKNCIQLVLFVINKTKFSQLENMILEQIKKLTIPIILVINKIDYIKNKKQLLPFIHYMSKKHQFLEIIPISAKTGKNVDILYKIIKNNLPQSKHLFSSADNTTISRNFMISEIIREKFIRLLNQEIPHCINIKIDLSYTDQYKVYNIISSIFVKNIRHKKILIGKQGNKIKLCHQLATQDIQQYIKKKIKLKLNIKIKKS